MSCDVQDAFLTVEQRDPTMIVAKDAVGHDNYMHQAEYFLDSELETNCGMKTSQITSSRHWIW